MTFNRTSLELKRRHSPIEIEAGFIAFNRTSLELKLQVRLAADATEYTFNRTSLELKLTNFSWTSRLRTRLLIEPVWN